MQLTGFVLTAALLATPLISATVFAADASVPPRGTDTIRLASACLPNTHWTDAGYTGGGKWRPAHCAKDDGTD